MQKLWRQLAPGLKEVTQLLQELLHLMQHRTLAERNKARKQRKTAARKAKKAEAIRRHNALLSQSIVTQQPQPSTSLEPVVTAGPSTNTTPPTTIPTALQSHSIVTQEPQPSTSYDSRGCDEDENDSRKKSKKQMPVLNNQLHEDFYNMNYPDRGKCIIFNHKYFDFLRTRFGTMVDVEDLKYLFRELEFEVTVFQDLTVREVLRELERARQEDHSHSSLFVLCVLSHGEEGMIYAKDGPYPIHKLFSPFNGDACPSLAGKPKFFIIQACQGPQVDHGVEISTRVSTDSARIPTNVFRIPIEADFIVGYCTAPGYMSWRHRSDGSWYIQALCAVFLEQWREMDVVTMLTKVSRKVALDYEHYVVNDTTGQLIHYKQIPFVTSTLTRNVKFPVP